MKLYKYIDNLLNSYTPASDKEESELLNDGWKQGAQMAYDCRHNNGAASDNNFRRNTEKLKAKHNLIVD